MAPTSGGQYHWVSEFAPKKHQKFLSYIVGKPDFLGWAPIIPISEALDPFNTPPILMTGLISAIIYQGRSVEHS